MAKATKKSDRLTYKRRLEMAEQANDLVQQARKAYWEAKMIAERLGDREGYGAMRVVYEGIAHTSVSPYSN